MSFIGMSSLPGWIDLYGKGSETWKGGGNLSERLNTKFLRSACMLPPGGIAVKQVRMGSGTGSKCGVATSHYSSKLTSCRSFALGDWGRG